MTQSLLMRAVDMVVMYTPRVVLMNISNKLSENVCDIKDE